MNTKNDSDALLNFYLYSDLEDEAAVDEYLEEAGIDFDSFYENLGTLIQEKKAGRKLLEGKRFKENYLKQLKQWAINNQQELEVTGDIQYAFRNLEKMDEKELKSLLDDDKKIELIKKLREK